MNDRLALAVGKIILAWGRLDQQLHVLIRAGEQAFAEPHSLEGRFTERRKIFRRICIRMTNDEEGYRRVFDRACAELVRLERKRGRIAHGYAELTNEGAMFFNVPEGFPKPGETAIEEVLLQFMFSYGDLDQLVTDIDQMRTTLTRLMAAAHTAWQQENHSAPEQ